jgi:hypothetical protein
MTSRDFCFWLQGYLDLADQTEVRVMPTTLSASQLALVRRNLRLVFSAEPTAIVFSAEPTAIAHDEGNRRAHLVDG